MIISACPGFSLLHSRWKSSNLQMEMEPLHHTHSAEHAIWIGEGMRSDLKHVLLHLLQCKILCHKACPLALFVIWSSLVLVSDVLHDAFQLLHSFHLTGAKVVNNRPP